jgi:hypothetical protein
MTASRLTEDRWRADVLEQLRRINTSIEALHAHGERQARLSAEGNAKVEATLGYLVRLWQAQQRKRTAR